MSPAWNQPSASASAVAPGLFQYSLNRCSPCSSTSPSSAMRTTEPGSGWPTVPIFWRSQGLKAVAAQDSVRP
ncbi:hypothetical protein SVIOM342S_08226 [Streptomyces violaceorubidus]